MEQESPIMFGQFHNRSTSILNLVLWSLLVLLGCVSAPASTVLVNITPEGIVIAADSKIVSKDFGGYSAPPAGPAKKIFLIRNRIAVGTVGFNVQTITTADDKPLFSYDPATWLKSIEQEEPQDISVTRLSEAGKTNSAGYRLIASQAPVELSIFLNRKDLSLRQASTLLRAILRAQNIYTPGFVGPPYNVAWLRKDGALIQIKYRD
jgi:hypothetical protein